jgi:EAL domain-containing protein (putative c-di-GMP-specific phosphodiesterase class I)
MGADHLQGYLLSRPLAPSVLSTWARERALERQGIAAHV